jgi:TonB family protein
MMALHSDDRSEPIYLCGTHADELKDPTVARTTRINALQSVASRISSEGPGARSTPALNGHQGRGHRYLLALVASVALAGGLFGPRLFHTILLRFKTPAVTAAPRRVTENRPLPQKEPRREQVAAPQKRPQTLPNELTRLQERPPQTADVAVGGTVARQVLPNVPKSASDTIRGTILVSVRVQVDGSGNVEHAELVYPGPSRYFARLAVESAQRWKFNPAIVAGQGSQNEWMIRFYFTRELTKALPTEGR